MYTLSPLYGTSYTLHTLIDKPGPVQGDVFLFMIAFFTIAVWNIVMLGSGSVGHSKRLATPPLASPGRQPKWHQGGQGMLCTVSSFLARHQRNYWHMPEQSIPLLPWRPFNGVAKSELHDKPAWHCAAERAHRCVLSLFFRAHWHSDERRRRMARNECSKCEPNASRVRKRGDGSVSRPNFADSRMCTENDEERQPNTPSAFLFLLPFSPN